LATGELATGELATGRFAMGAAVAFIYAACHYCQRVYWCIFWVLYWRTSAALGISLFYINQYADINMRT